MKLTELHQLNKDYEYLMAFVGLGEVYNQLGLTEYTNDELERLECTIRFHLDKEDQKELKQSLEKVKDLIKVAMNEMERKVKKSKTIKL